jgi:short-subunit dehydrogenase
VSWTLADGVAVVTGAASGIGRATAIALARRGCHLALVDRNAAGLQETAAAIGTAVRVTCHAIDVTDRAAVAALPEQVAAAHGRVTVLLNGAGVALLGRFEEVDLDEFRWLVEINFLALVGVTKAFLPIMLREPRAQIANVSSIYGIIAPAEQTAYVASKFAVRGFSESLRHELEGTGVGVTVIHPGGVRTGIATSARIAAGADQAATRESRQRFTDGFLRLPPEAAAAAIVRAIERRQKRLLIGVDARAAAFVQWLLPVRYWKIVKMRYAAYLIGRRPPPR